jgi:LPXTG-site transpeptidase (sortase) family protein
METDNKEEAGGSNRFVKILINFGKILVIFAFVFSIVYIILNFNSLYSQVKYWFQTDIKKTQYQAPIIISQLPSPNLNSNSVDTSASRSVDNNSSTDSNSNNSEANDDGINLANNQLAIPKIDVSAPVLWNIQADKAIDKLREGLVHIKQTALPGDKDGNVFITGHSSYYPWDPGKYKHIFALLPNLKKGDKIYIKYHGTLYKYEIFETVVVKSNETWVMQPDNRNMVSLMTCVPIGTSLRRFVARAQQIKPSPIRVAQDSKEEKEEISSPERNQRIPDDLMPRIFN